MFSGQGSQYYQMGRDLFTYDCTFRRAMLQLDEIVRSLAGFSIVTALYESGRSISERFDRVLFTHPAIFLVETALLAVLVERGVVPDFILGASMGAFAAVAAAGCVGMQDMLMAVVQQAMMIERHCKPGGMLAVFGSPELHKDKVLSRLCEIASVNFTSHFVLAALEPELNEARARLSALGIPFQQLPVNYAFHSRWIDDAQPYFCSFLKTLPSNEAHYPIVCGSTGRRMLMPPPNYLWTVIREPVCFSDVVGTLEAMSPHIYIDLGPSGTLATFVKNNLAPESSLRRVFSVMSPFGGDLKRLNSVLSGVAS